MPPYQLFKIQYHPTSCSKYKDEILHFQGELTLISLKLHSTTLSKVKGNFLTHTVGCIAPDKEHYCGEHGTWCIAHYLFSLQTKQTGEVKVINGHFSDASVDLLHTHWGVFDDTHQLPVNGLYNGFVRGQEWIDGALENNVTVGWSYDTVAPHELLQTLPKAMWLQGYQGPSLHHHQGECYSHTSFLLS